MNYGKPSRYRPREFITAGIYPDKLPQGQPYFCLGRSKKNNQYGLFNERYGTYTLQEDFRLLDGREDTAVIDVGMKTHTGATFPQQFCYSLRGEEHIVTAHIENRDINGELIISKNPDLSEPNTNYQVIHVPTLEDVIATHLARLTGEERITPETAQKEYEQLLTEVPIYHWNFVRGIIS